MVTVLFLTCKRLQYLHKTAAAIRRHFNEVEPQARPAYICLDNGSPSTDRQLLEAMGFDLLILSRENLGIGPAMNVLVSAVRTPYVLNLQDDWLLENPRQIPFFAEACQIFESDPKVGQVKLDSYHHLDFKDRTFYDGPFSAKGKIGHYVQNPGMLWGGFTFPPAITRMSAVYDVGPFTEEQPFRRGWAESEYSARSSRKYVSVKSPEFLLFKHIGDQPSPGWIQEQGNQV